MSDASTDPVERYCENLTVFAQTRPFAEPPTYAKEIAQAIQVLEGRYGQNGRRGQRYNPAFLGEDAAERRHTLEGAAVALMRDDVSAVPVYASYRSSNTRRSWMALMRVG